MSDTRADIIRVLHRAYVDNGWVPPTLDGYADALLAAGYGKVEKAIGARVQQTIDRFGPDAPITVMFISDRPMTDADVARGQELAHELAQEAQPSTDLTEPSS